MNELDNAWTKDECPDCGGDVQWDLDEASTGGDSYDGLCSCGSAFRAQMVAQLDSVVRIK